MNTNLRQFLFRSLYIGGVCSSLIAGTAQAQEHQRAHIGLVYPLSTNGTKAAKVGNTFSLHALAGVSAYEKGLAISGLATIVKDSEDGVMISGLANIIGGPTTGVQVAGLTNTIKSHAKGVQIAGLANTAASSHGAQVAGLANVVKQDASVQISGLANVAKASALQIAGIANMSPKDNKMQISGIASVAGNTNAQISGLVNVARKVKGVQIAGLINIAEDSKYPIGILNFIKNGEQQIGLTVDEVGNTILGLRTGGQKTYGIIGIGGNAFMNDAPFVMEAGIGLHLGLSKMLRINLELSNTANSNFLETSYYKSSFRALLGLKLWNKVELVAGPSFNYVNYMDYQEAYMSHNLWEFRGTQSVNSFFIGGTAGIHINL